MLLLFSCNSSLQKEYKKIRREKWKLQAKEEGKKCKSWENILINECGEIQIRHSSDFNSAAKSTKVFLHRCVDKHEQLPKQTDTQSGRKSCISYTDKDRDERAKRQGSTWGTLSPESSDKQWEGSGKKKKKMLFRLSQCPISLSICFSFDSPHYATLYIQVCSLHQRTVRVETGFKKTEASAQRAEPADAFTPRDINSVCWVLRGKVVFHQTETDERGPLIGEQPSIPGC